MNQIVITKRSDGTFKVNVMGQGRTDETYYLTGVVIAEVLDLLLNKLVAVENAI